MAPIALRLAPVLTLRPQNPRPGLRRAGHAHPPAHAFIATGYTIWIGGIAVRYMQAAPGGFVEVP